MSPTLNGRSMRVIGLFSAFGLSMGPFFGGILYEAFVSEPIMPWSGIALIVTSSAVGFIYLGRVASDKYDRAAGAEPANAKG